MKTKLSLLTVLAAALFWGGCGSIIYSENDLGRALNENADFENGLQGWVIKEGTAEIIPNSKSPFSGDKVLRLKISKNGYARIESSKSFKFKPGEKYRIASTVKGFEVRSSSAYSLRSGWCKIRFGPVPISKVKGGYAYAHPLIVGWSHISGGFSVPPAPQKIPGIPLSPENAEKSRDVDGPLWFEFRPYNPLQRLEFIIDNFAIIKK